LKQKLIEFLGDSPFNLIEVERLRTGYCQLLQVLNFEELDKLIKDAKVSHLSTWMIVKDPALKPSLVSVTGPEILPVSIKVRHFGNENIVRVYNNLCLGDLIDKIGEITQIEAKQLSVKVVEDTIIRRVDRKIVNQDNPTIKNTLKDLKIIDNSALLVELKDPTELQEQEDVI